MIATRLSRRAVIATSFAFSWLAWATDMRDEYSYRRFKRSSRTSAGSTYSYLSRSYGVYAERTIFIWFCQFWERFSVETASDSLPAIKLNCFHPYSYEIHSIAFILSKSRWFRCINDVFFDHQMQVHRFKKLMLALFRTISAIDKIFVPFIISDKTIS